VNVMDEAPIGSSVVFTARNPPRRPGPLKDAWMVGPEQLMLDDAELLELWRRMTGNPAAEACDVPLAEESGRHAALAALIARERALNPSPVRWQERDASSLVRDLAEQQLSQDAMRVLLSLR